MTSSLVAAIALTPIASAPAQAQDAREIIGGLLLGGAIGVAIGAATQPQPPRVVQPQPVAPPPTAQPPRQTQPRAPRPTRPAIPATEAGRQVQTALNYFGFDAGFVDGQVGPATRSAVERFQTFQGYPVNGRSFPEDQALHLINAYRWATNGGAAQTGLSEQPLLLAYERVLAGDTVTPAGAPNSTTVIVNPAATTVVASGTETPVTTVSAQPGAPVPNLFANAAATPALSARCDAVALQGQANGGMMTLGNLSNPGFALSEQFCTARASAVNQGHDLTQAITGLSFADITEQCEGFSAAVAPQTTLLTSLTPLQAMASAEGFARATGMPQAELAGTARVCLGVGYGVDDMEMALGAALMLVATNEPAYGELIGHHLREGFGVESDEALAQSWFATSLDAVEAGAPAVFSPTDAGRLPLIRQAVAMSIGGAPVPVPAAASVVQVPSFNITPQPAPAPTPAPVTVQAPTPAPITVPTPTPVNGTPSGNVEVEPEIVFAPQSVLPTFQVNQ
ncbi:peptidoglycan-binding domain-containing protein [Gymnodinialimonas ceratoperidinii]|uniref:Peptidoglycan-binding protein n=1 Tax=Gymnodinialimonas ceratoperidinii TaxID=2856823 RepID=A0A8F6TUC6_9RHOB|nr:peptidoglycan-binding domain-containing protein [Gymnodinialimonas ceratoperidinii]QXT39117.1 peptidoglycan-binding protein [Gymnodinialimonas ceratoperidinii]